MFKLTLATLMLVVGTAAHARTFGYLCHGTVDDGIGTQVTVAGRWDADTDSATTPMYVSSTDDFSASSIPGYGQSSGKVHAVSRSAVRIHRVGDTLQITANANNFNVFISYPDVSSHATTMSVDIGNWSHQFTHASCQPGLD